MTETVQRKPRYEWGSETAIDEQPDRVASEFEDYQTGDPINVIDDEIDGINQYEIIGWSTVFEPSVPVIEAPHTDFPDSPWYIDECAITPESHAGPFEWVDVDE